jgi:hypothetical protein
MELDLQVTPERTILDLRSLGVPHLRVLGRYRYLRAHPPLADHSHPGMMEISYLARGTQNYWMGKKCFRMSGGDLFVTLPDWMILELPDKPFNFMGLPPGQAEAYWQGLRSFPHRHCSAGSGLQPILEKVFRTSISPTTPLQQARMHLGILEYLLEIIALAQRDPIRALSPAMAAVVDHIEHHIEEPLPVERLAR